jgi:PTH1 family peptidyl-tRNA hydrolase
MRLIVGLGNPGQRYRDTPHNAGFLACDRFAERNRLGAEARKFQGRFRRGTFAGEDVGVLKPETYMNLSGRSVAEALRYLPVEPGGLIVVLDDMDVPAGKLRLRHSGGDAGHNGLRSVIDHVGTREFPRVRIGIGRPTPERDATAHVLSRPPEQEQRRLALTVELAAEALETILAEGIEAAMNRYNGLPPVGGEEEGSR